MPEAPAAPSVRGAATVGTYGWVGAGLLLLGGLMLSSTLAGTAGFILGILALTAVVFAAGNGGPAILLTALVAQNLFISLFSPLLETRLGLFGLLQAGNFVLLALVGGMSGLWLWRQRAHLPPAQHQLLMGAGICLILLAAYAALGLVLGNPPKNTAIYFRTLSSGILLMVAGLYFGRICGWQQVLRALGAVTLLAALYGWTELFATEWLYNTIHYQNFLDLKYANRQSFDNILAIIETFTRSFLNFPLFAQMGLTSFRLGGPNLHPISFAYVLTIGALVATLRGHWWWLPVFLIPMAEIGAKGPLILFVLCLLLLALHTLTRSTRLTAIAAIGGSVVYVLGGVIYGLRTGDYHVIGLMGGVSGFLRNPLGHGLGAGGNFGAASDESFAWQSTQTFGADFGLESSYGVMLYQIGLATFLLTAFYLLVARHLLAKTPGIPLLAPIMLAMVLVNGVFQEEAFSPYAIGLIALMAGALLTEKDPAHA